MRKLCGVKLPIFNHAGIAVFAENRDDLTNMKRVEEGAKAKPKARRASRASGGRKPAAAKKTANAGTKAKPPPKAGAKAKPAASEAKPIKMRRGQKVAVVLSGGNPRIAKEDGDAPVQAYIAGMLGWKGDLGKRLDALIVRNVPNVRKAVKWNSPFYGIEGRGWFLGFHTFTHYVKVGFFRGTSLRPVPPGASKGKDTRYIDIHEGDELDEAQMANWVKQAAALPGFLAPRP
jgi:hypothetical protein